MTAPTPLTRHTIEIRPSDWDKRLLIGIVSLLVLSVWLWQPYISAFQTQLQLAMSALLVLLGWHYWPAARPSHWVWLNEDGHWQWANTNSEPQTWLIQPNSRLMPGVVWVKLSHTLTCEVCWLTLYKDSLSESDYRLLCRVVRFIQQKESEHE